jgi:hypothetical protein
MEAVRATADSKWSPARLYLVISGVWLASNAADQVAHASLALGGLATGFASPRHHASP